ncbi:MAG: thioredoxin [Methyloligellaceae bacterium]
MATVNVSDATFEEEVLKSSEPVVVDFWAEWCGPCKQIAPALEELSNELAGKVKIAKMDMEANEKIPQELGIMNLPTMLLFKDGKVVDTKIGSSPKTAIEKWINEAIA